MNLRKTFNNVDITGYRKEHPELFRYVRDEMTKTGRQFLLLGDTHHNCDDLFAFFRSPALPALFHYAGINRFCYEMPREVQDTAALSAYIDLIGTEASGKDFKRHEKSYWHDSIKKLRRVYRDTPLEKANLLPAVLGERRRKIETKLRKGKIDKKEARRALKAVDKAHAKTLRFLWGAHVLGFPHTGIDTFAVDSIQWRTGFVPNTYFRIYIGDHEVSDEVRAKANSQKTALLYGQYHFTFEGGLGSRFSEAEALRIDIYPDKQSYKNWLIGRKEHHDIMPDRVYFLAEKELVKPDTELEQGILSKRDYSRWAQWHTYVAAHFTDGKITDHARAELEKIQKLPHIAPRYLAYTPPVRKRKNTQRAEPA